jgi:hypothetical protein
VAAVLERDDHRPFLGRRHTTDDRRVLERRAQRGGILGKRPRVYRSIGPRKTEPPGDRADGPRIVARDHLHRDVLLLEVPQGLGHARTEYVAEHDDRRGDEP